MSRSPGEACRFRPPVTLAGEVCPSVASPEMSAHVGMAGGLRTPYRTRIPRRRGLDLSPVQALVSGARLHSVTGGLQDGSGKRREAVVRGAVVRRPRPAGVAAVADLGKILEDLLHGDRRAAALRLGFRVVIIPARELQPEERYPCSTRTGPGDEEGVE